ncbi:uncharacterized protein LOC105231510 [Bactrocera dorsalis]|uniref:Uncharacterized protein LOC105231510 n=1 Tax=Bactrocera dorsalis TaxID=27457 RepID=A0A6I9VL57_BACDO|nr:uncharacterized protein LOC105231510 [Bactrocera dorsalis]
METSNDQVDSNRSNVEDTNINKEIKTESQIICYDNYVNKTPHNTYNECVLLEKEDENTMIEDKINVDVTGFGTSTNQPKDLNISENDEKCIVSPPTKCQADCFHDSIEREDLQKNNFVEIRNEEKNPAEENVHELPAKEEKAAAAAEISQQNYENTLRCQNQDFISEVIEKNTNFQYDESEDSMDSSNIAENKAEEQEKKMIAEAENTHVDKLNYFGLKAESLDKKLIHQEIKNNKSNEDDSFQSIATSDSNTKQPSPPGNPNDDYSIEEPPTNKKTSEDSDLIDITEDDSQNGNRIEISKSNHIEKDNNRSEIGSEGSHFTTDDDSNEGKENKVIEIDNYEREQSSESSSIQDDIKYDEINQVVMENTQSNIGLLIKEKEASLDGKSCVQNNNLQTPLKLNGDHKITPKPKWESQMDNSTELETQLDAKSPEINDKEHPKVAEIEECEKFKNNSLEKKNTDDKELDIDNKLNKTGISNYSMSAESQQSKVNCDDENSQCSSLASTDSNSTATSSSQQLVIDQPMDESDVGISAASTACGKINSLMQSHDTSEKVNTLKPSLKRKLSSSNETGSSPLHKQPHIDLELNDNENSRYSCDKDQTEAMPELITEERNSMPFSDITHKVDAEYAPLKSLLLQHLQKPYSPPPSTERLAEYPAPALPNFTQQLDKISFGTASPKFPATISSPNGNISTPTKYLCFKCKVGNFASFAALNEHQRECLADTRLLPARLNENSNILHLSLAPQLATPPSSASPDATVDMTARNAIQTPLSSFIPPSVPDAATQKKRYYKCSSCNTFHENWNLFLHIRDKHLRHMCLYCIRFFPTAEKLSVHLEIKHDLEQNHFNSEEALRKSVSMVEGTPSESRFLMCCTCQHLFEESEPFSDHNCAEFMKPCTLCGQKGRHSNQCKAHPDAKRTSKSKKRLKKSISEAPQSDSSRNHKLLPSIPPGDGNTNAASLNCDNNQNSQPSMEKTRPGSDILIHSEDSNSSSNMVIDESCTTTHNSIVNPFKELDERWQLEQQAQNKTDFNLFSGRNESLVEPKLIVPKFKLRVPKEFQKSVDVALSSTESEADEEDEENDGAVNAYGDKGQSQMKHYNVTDIATGFLDENSLHLNADKHSVVATADGPASSQKRIDEDNSQESRSVDKEWMDGTSTNLVRILQEIERTKLDIQRTKETLHHTLKAKQDISDEALTTSAQNTRNWTPTPPTSPKQARCPTPGESDKVTTSPFTDAVTPQLLPENSQTSQRRDSAGSDAMDIDETITGTLPQQPPRETEEHSHNIDASNTSQELNTSSESNATVNIMNSRADTAPSPLLREQLMDIDLSPIKQEQEFSNKDIRPAVEVPEQIEHMQSVSTEIKESVLEDGIEVASEDILATDLQLDRPLEKMEIVEFIRTCLRAVYPLCLYCNHARRIAVNGQSLVLHMLAQHRFNATVDSITAEELKPDTICAKMKTFLPVLENEFFNSSSYCTMGDSVPSHSFNERIFECFQCRFVTSTHKELYLHNRKMHLKTAILCFMCRANFFSFSEILCHICPGVPNKTPVFDVKFRCCLCDVDNIPSPFRLMVHLRKRHFACDVCLEDCRDQGRLSSHVWKHKLHHLCYRCGIAYRNKMDITKHLFWKHGTESINCKRCLQKRWRHVYHFCVPPITFNCDVCNLCFSKAMYLKVHKRLHSGDLRYPCSEENCDEKFISRKLLLKHTSSHLQQEVHVPALEQTGNHDAVDTFKEKGECEFEDSNERGNFTIDQNNKSKNIDIKKEVIESNTEPNTLAKGEENNSNYKVDGECKSGSNIDVKNIDFSKDEKTALGQDKSEETPRKKKKKNKRSKESLEDLNLIAPNLSETDSSDESEIDSKSKGDEDSLVPKVMLSPPSEAENDMEDLKTSKVDGQQGKGDKQSSLKDAENVDSVGTGKVLEIWKNFLQAQQDSTNHDMDPEATLKTEADYDEDNYPTPRSLHVAYSDHDYCQMFRPPSPPPPSVSVKAETKETLPVLSPTKRNKVSKSPRHLSSHHSASSSSSSSSSSSDSSCSCGSNCSCSSSGSDSSSSSSSSDDSDSSLASNASRKRHHKKSERDRLRKKSESVSPLKKHSNSETINVVDDDLANEVVANTITERSPSLPKEPQIYESDLETAESETDEEFYDEHPQKLASELLAQKRAQLMAQTRLSPSHNFDIVENSRPSTPSLPEDVVCETTRVKLKKKKRDRKSGSKMNLTVNATSAAEKAKSEKNKTLIETVTPVPLSGIDIKCSYKVAQSSKTVTDPSVVQQSNITMSYAPLTLPAVEQLTPRPIATSSHLPSRMSEGSSCSDADGSLKRSKRARRPNKFYGYTSDDENSGINLGQSLMIGMRAIKPQPPPQLTWRKEDLPTPSKSILNPKSKTARTLKTPGTPVNTLSGGMPHLSASTSSKKKRSAENSEKSSTRRRPAKKASLSNTLPPIPTLKIRPSQLGLNSDGSTTGTERFPTPQIYSSSKDTDDEDDDNSSDPSSDDETGVRRHACLTASTSKQWNKNSQMATIVPAVHTQQPTAPAPLPVLQTPQATVFNHKIPPALLPNPNFETLQYFKANNIRYPIRPPAGARQAREGESVYCYCRCPYDEVSEMIACDGENCLIEWFHFECVGIMVAPQGKWFCAECRPKYSEELYPTGGNV